VALLRLPLLHPKHGGMFLQNEDDVSHYFQLHLSLQRL
jgi:hypothetical protein